MKWCSTIVLIFLIIIMKPHEKEAAKDFFDNAIEECENSQFSMTEAEESQTQQFTALDTELTQTGDISNFSPPSQPQAIDARQVPWGRLIAEEGEGRYELLPRDPAVAHNCFPRGHGVTFLGCLKNILPSDKFNEYSLGRNSKTDIQAIRPSKRALSTDIFQIHRWAHSMISNRHCNIFCMLKPGEGMDVFVEDSSGNGTVINGTTLLKKGEKRLLHTGDEICLVNPIPLRKKIGSKEIITRVQRRYTYVFVNAFHQNDCYFSSGKRKRKNMITPSANKRRGLVDVRSMLCKSFEQPSPENNALCTSPDCSSEAKRRFEQFYDVRDTLGTGTCGEVKRAISRKTGKEFAVKTIQLSGRNRGANMSEQASAALRAEASILQTLDHPYIVKLQDVFVVPGVAIYIVMELVSGGDLFDRIVSKGRYTEVECRRAMRRLLNAIFYLHEKMSLVHRDLKPENILCISASNNVDLKLTDFGLAKNITSEGLKTFCGTPQYFAPEVLRRNYTIAGKGRYGKEADMWSLGVILYVLLSGSPPYDLSEGFEVVADGKIKFPEAQWKGISSAAKDLVKQLLEIDVGKRLSAEDACEHSWILMEDGDSHTHPLDNPEAPLRHAENENAPTEMPRNTDKGACSNSEQSPLDSKSKDATSTRQITPTNNVQTNQVTPPEQLAYPHRDINHRSNNFREVIARSAEKDEQRLRRISNSKKGNDSDFCSSPMLGTAETVRVKISCAKNEMEKPGEQNKPNANLLDSKSKDLSDDEICSQFSVVDSSYSIDSNPIAIKSDSDAEKVAEISRSDSSSSSYSDGIKGQGKKRHQGEKENLGPCTVQDDILVQKEATKAKISVVEVGKAGEKPERAFRNPAYSCGKQTKLSSWLRKKIA